MELVSRQRILSRSRDDLYNTAYEDEDVWFDIETLIKVINLVCTKFRLHNEKSFKADLYSSS